jgi:hypothetical protein
LGQEWAEQRSRWKPGLRPIQVLLAK